MALIQIEHITKDYGNDRGVFDVSFEIEKGEVFGFLGPNGAGKTITIRQMVGFIRLIQVLSGYDIHYISEVKQTLEDDFMHFYDSKAVPKWNHAG